MRITEGRLRRIIRSVIAESGYRVGDLSNPKHMNQVYSREQGFEKLEKEYLRLMPVGGTGQDLEEMLSNNGINSSDVKTVSREGDEVTFYAGNEKHVLRKGLYSIELD